MSEILQSKISGVRRKSITVALATGVVAAAGAFLLILAVSMLLDFWLNLSFTARAALLAINLAAVASILLYSVFGPILYGPDDDEIALMVEDAEPAFRTRLIASVQLGRPNAAPAGASTSLIRAMIAQAESLAGPMDFGRVVRTDRLTRIAVVAAVIAACFSGAFAWGGENSRVLLGRSLFLSDTPVPRKTQVLVITGGPLIAKGDPIEILAIAEGVTPPDDKRRAALKTLPDEKGESSRRQDLTLEPITLDAVRLDQLRQAVANSRQPDDAAKRVLAALDKNGTNTLVYGATLENLQESFEYTVRLNDGESPKYTVKVLPRPAITKVEAKQVYPAYTGKPIETRALGDLSLLRGSKLQLAVTVNKPLKPATDQDKLPNFAHLIGTDKDYALAVDPKNPNQLTGEIELPKGTTGFSINLTDTDGLRSKDPAVYRVDLIDDKAPTVRILSPTRKEVQVTQEATHKITFQATDDFAIGAASIKYKVDDGQESTVKLDLKEKLKTFAGQHQWKIQEILAATPGKQSLEGSVIEYWVEVEDTRDAPNGGPNKGVSEHYMLRVVTKDELREIFRTRIADIGSGIRTATEDQDNLAGRVQVILLEKKAEPVPK